MGNRFTRSNQAIAARDRPEAERRALGLQTVFARSVNPAIIGIGLIGFIGLWFADTVRAGGVDPGQE
jgi:hypothetical protein